MHNILISAAAAQDETFATMMGVLPSGADGHQQIDQAVHALEDLQRTFGDGGRANP